MTRTRSTIHALIPALFLLLALSGCGGSDSPSNPPGPSALSIDGGALAMGVVGTAYSATVEATGGTPNYEFALDHGLLPPGLVAEWNDNDLVFNGTPTTAGTYTVPVQVIDADDRAANAVIVIHVVAAVDVSGDWSMVITVTRATGACAGEEGVSPAETVTIVQDGANVTVSGFLGVPSNALTGTIGGDNGSTVTISGTIDEDGGETTATHIWSLTSPTTMSGIENWSWTDGIGSCPGSMSTVECVKVTK